VEATLRDTVEGLLTQTHRPLEIILVENGSTDGTRVLAERLADEYAEVRAASVQPSPTDYPVSVATNVGVGMAKHPVILRLDDDTSLKQDAIARALAELIASNASAVACNLRIRNPDGSLWTRLQAIEYLLAMDLDRRWQALFDSVICCSGAMSMFRRSAIIAAGGFVSAPRLMSEDMDMTLRAHERGCVPVAPEAIGFTTVPTTLGDLLAQRARWGASGTMSVYLHRHGIGRRASWHSRWLGVVGLPLKLGIVVRELLGPVVLLDLWLLWANEGPRWLALMCAAHLGARGAQLALLAPALARRDARQGLRWWWLLPVLTFVYGPLIAVARCVGAWKGIRNIVELRRRADVVERRGLVLRLADDDGAPVPELGYAERVAR
jgi:hypothetical protein